MFVGVVAPIDPHVETPEEVCDRVLEAAEYIPVAQLGTTDDCGFSPFSDDTSTTRDTAFAKIRARVVGTDACRRTSREPLSRELVPLDDEEDQLRSVAIQNAQSILLARQRAEQELVAAKEALEARTAELERANALIRTIAENAASCLLMLDDHGIATYMNPAALGADRLHAGGARARTVPRRSCTRPSERGGHTVEDCPIRNARERLHAAQESSRSLRAQGRIDVSRLLFALRRCSARARRRRRARVPRHHRRAGSRRRRSRTRTGGRTSSWPRSPTSCARR